jgi:hypothetical protein
MKGPLDPIESKTHRPASAFVLADHARQAVVFLWSGR